MYGLILTGKFRKKTYRLFWKLPLLHPVGCIWRHGILPLVQNADKLAELNERIKGAFAKSDEPKLQERGHSKAYCCYYHAPTLVIVSNEPTQWWAGMDCACAIENMFLAAHSLGIGSCWINQLGTTCDDPEVREFISSLGVPENHKVYGCVALGYADPKISLREKMVKAGTVTVVR